LVELVEGEGREEAPLTPSSPPFAPIEKLLLLLFGTILALTSRLLAGIAT